MLNKGHGRKVAQTLENNLLPVSGKAMSVSNEEDILSKCSVSTSSGSVTLTSAKRVIVGNTQFYSFAVLCKTEMSSQNDIDITISDGNLKKGYGDGTSYSGGYIFIANAYDNKKIRIRNSNGFPANYDFVLSFVSPLFK